MKDGSQRREFNIARKTEGERKEKGRQAHRIDADVLGEAEGGPERLIPPENSDVEDEFIASIASRLDSLNRDDTDDDAEL
jgi:hypothetical protein